jgi:hypothetical protein
MPKYESIVHILWELPFPLRLTPTAFFIWEPAEGVALFDPKPEVGELAWKRKSDLLEAKEVFTNVGMPNQCYPVHNYLITSKLISGIEVKTAHLTGGPEGGFYEARPYTIANIFLCLHKKDNYSKSSTLKRAGVALNNILDVYRFLTMDPLVRSVRADLDSYYTLVSVAELPIDTGDIEPKEALRMVGSLSFGTVIGKNRIHHVGLNSFEDLLLGDVIPAESLHLFESLITRPHDLELFQQLIFSAIRRLKRNEHALAVLDAQSAFESLVAVLIFESLQNQGQSAQEIEAQMGNRGRLHTLQRRLEELDRIAASQSPTGTQSQKFLGSPEEARWRKDLYSLRNQIVHEGNRSVAFDDAKAGLVAGLHAIYTVQNLTPAFGRQMIWSGDALDLTHLRKSSGRLSRFFEN